MDYSAIIIQHLHQAPDFMEVFLTPSAPPVCRNGKEMTVMSDQNLSPYDIQETLKWFKSQLFTGKMEDQDKEEGAFSFGLKNVGRFKVIYFSQRGSSVVKIHKIPANIPVFKELVEDDCYAQIQSHKIFEKHRDGIIVVTGLNSLRNSTFVYSMLNELNNCNSKIIDYLYG